ncbi:hypothetical protein MAL1_00207 [Bacteriophage DSS3_MAL1]|nr:hypothetical protein MAL1_00207 [Bacteriophage DSS3_MAL1]
MSETTGRYRPTTEEDHLRESLAELQRQYRRAAEPIVQRLAELEARKPVIMHLDLSQIEARVLAHLQQKDPQADILRQMNKDMIPLPEEPEKEDDPCPCCGKELEDGPGGGVVCPDKKGCGYWFCY